MLRGEELVKGLLLGLPLVGRCLLPPKPHPSEGYPLHPPSSDGHIPHGQVQAQWFALWKTLVEDTLR